MTTLDWIELDRKHCWHPFTAQADWTSLENPPLLLASGRGVWLQDTEGREYLDGNSSIWTNIHGHSHPSLNEAMEEQLKKVAHTSYLGFGHPLASELASRLCGFFPEQTLTRCFFSDNGSTAIEVAMKMSLQSRMQSGKHEKQQFICFHNAYHGDTMGAASLGGVSLFFDRFAGLGLPVIKMRKVQDIEALTKEEIARTTAVIIEPIIQGVNQMTPWEEGSLKTLKVWTEKNDIHLILDEVMTGFGRTGAMFASQKEEVIPDFLCLAKGLTGGYIPMAATLTTEDIYETFLEKREHTFYYGHSYTANPMGCAVAMASLDLFEKEQTLVNVAERSRELSALFTEELEPLACVSEVRQVGLVSGIELKASENSSDQSGRSLGAEVCQVARSHQFLTRPILNTIVFMPPLCITSEELQFGVKALKNAILETLG